MTLSEYQLLLAFALVGLVMLAAYTIYIRMKLWFMNRVLERMAVISTYNEPPRRGSGGGGGGALAFILIVLAALAAFFLLIS